MVTTLQTIKHSNYAIFLLRAFWVKNLYFIMVSDYSFSISINGLRFQRKRYLLFWYYKNKEVLMLIWKGTFGETNYLIKIGKNGNKKNKEFKIFYYGCNFMDFSLYDSLSPSI